MRESIIELLTELKIYIEATETSLSKLKYSFRALYEILESELDDSDDEPRLIFTCVD